MQCERWTFIDGGFVEAEDDVSNIGVTAIGPRVLEMPVPMNCHAHLIDALIPGSPPRDLAGAVVGTGSFKHEGVTRLLRETTPESFRSRFMTLYPSFTGNVVEFRDGGIAGAKLGRFGKDHFILGRPAENETEEMIPFIDGISISGINDHKREYVDECREIARKSNIPFALHASESVREDIDAILSLEPSFLVHLCKATHSDISRVAGEGIPVVVCPRSTAFFGGTVPLREMVDAGVQLTVGTDNAMVSAPFAYQEAAEMVRFAGMREEEAVNLVIGGKSIFSRIFTVIDETKRMYWNLGEGQTPFSALSRPPDLVA